MQIHPRDVISYQIKTKSQWPELRSWLNKKKGRVNPLSISEISEDSNIEFALFSARVLPQEYDEVAHKLAVAFALGSDSKLEAAACENAEIALPYRELKQGILDYTAGGISDKDLRNIRWDFDVRLQRAKISKKSLAASNAIIAAAAPFPWGAASVAQRRALDAVKLISKKDDVDTALEEEMDYHSLLLDHLCDRTD